MPPLAPPQPPTLRSTFDVIRAAGYPPASQGEPEGLIAHHAAEMVWNHWRRALASAAGGVPFESRVGRNDLCPCGSGRKYKKCCMTKASPPPEPARPDAPLAIPFGPELLPRLTDGDAMEADARLLEELFARDPELRKIRFHPQRADAFFIKSMKEAPPSAAQAQEQIDAIALAFFAQANDAKTLRRLDERLAEAGARATRAEELRALAFGVVLAMGSDSPGAGGRVLIPLIFRLSVLDGAPIEHRAAPVFDRLRDQVSAAGPRLDPSDPEAEGNVAKLIDQLSPADQALLEAYTEDFTDRLEKAIRSSWYPLGLSLASVAPFLFRVVHHRGKGQVPHREILETAAEAFGPDDQRLYVAALEKWLAEHPHLDASQRQVLEQLLYVGREQSLKPFADLLIVAAVRGERITFQDEEESRLYSTWDEKNDDPAFLERYAVYLDSKGYPLLGARMRALAVELAPPSAD